jgi:hypothetical protein
MLLRLSTLSSTPREKHIGRCQGKYNCLLSTTFNAKDNYVDRNQHSCPFLKAAPHAIFTYSKSKTFKLTSVLLVYSRFIPDPNE